AALRAGLGFDHDRLRLETALELAGTLFFVQSVPGSGRLQVGYLLKRGIRGGNSKAARDQEITRIPIGDVFDLAGFGNVGDVLFEKNLHDRTASPIRIEQMCYTAKGRARQNAW